MWITVPKTLRVRTLQYTSPPTSEREEESDGEEQSDRHSVMSHEVLEDQTPVHSDEMEVSSGNLELTDPDVLRYRVVRHQR